MPLPVHPPSFRHATATPSFPPSSLGPSVHIAPDRSFHSIAVLKASSFRSTKTLPWEQAECLSEISAVVVADVDMLRSGLHDSCRDVSKDALFVCILVSDIPLHAARRAMAATCRCLEDSGRLSLHDQFLSQTTTGHTRPPNLLHPSSGRQEKRKILASRQEPTPPSPPRHQPPGCTSTSISLSSPVTGLSEVSSSGGADALRSLRGGEGDLHPLATRRASLFAGYTLAWVLHLRRTA